MKRKLALTLSCFSILTLFMTGCGEVATIADAESTAATESGSIEEPSSELAQADLTATPSPTASPIPTATPVPTATSSPEPATQTVSPDYSATGTQTASTSKNWTQDERFMISIAGEACTDLGQADFGIYLGFL